MPATIEITYKFKLKNNSDAVFRVEFEEKSMTPIHRDEGDIPEWAKLDTFKCPNCSLCSEEHPYCPLARSIAPVIDFSRELESRDAIMMDVYSSERTVSMAVKTEEGIRSLLGLCIATSGCPRTQFLKPMARFHLPSSNAKETLIRATSMYLLAQYFRKQNGLESEWGLEGLKLLYEELQKVNENIEKRITPTLKNDAALNAVMILDALAALMNSSVNEALSTLRPLFESYLKD